MSALTQRQQQILNFIQARQASFGVAPSLREIAKEFGFRSMTAAADHVRALRRKGALVHHPRLARAHTIAPGFSSTPSATAAIPVLSEPAPATPAVSPAASPAPADAPSAGPAAPGEPEAPRHDRFLHLTPETLGLASSPALCAIEVRGEAMIGRQMLHGDIALVDGARTPAPGDAVAAEIQGQFAIRTIVVADDEICLRAEIPGAPELIPAAGIPIKGVVVGLFRRTVSDPSGRGSTTGPGATAGIDLRRQP